MEYDKSLSKNQLKDEEKQQFEILAHYLISQGGEVELSYNGFAQILEKNTGLKVPTITAERRLKKFKELDLIDIISPDRAGRNPNTISLKSYTYRNSPLTGIVPLNNPLYVTRLADQHCREALTLTQNSQDCLPFLRIKAAKGMGKSSLLVRLHDFLEKEQKYKVAYIDLGSDEFESEVFNDLNQLLYRFTEQVASAFKNSVSYLNLLDLKSYWRPERSPGSNCTRYLYELFKQIKQPKTLIIDGIDRVLGQKIQTDFLEMLRSWNETKMKVVSNSPIVWSSIVIAYSTEPYPDHNFKGSPVSNIGIPVELQEFTSEDIIKLSQIYGLNWSHQEAINLMNLIGGHPNLVLLAFHKMTQDHLSFVELEQQAARVNGPFGNYLLKFLDILQKDDHLRNCFKQIIQGQKCGDEFKIWQLDCVGLIQLDGEGVRVRCELYRKYFSQNLS